MASPNGAGLSKRYTAGDNAAVVMTQAIHTRFVDIAQGLSPILADAISTTPPIQHIPRRDIPFPARLCQAVAGQQLAV